MQRSKRHGEFSTNRHGDARYNILYSYPLNSFPSTLVLVLNSFSSFFLSFLGAIVNLLISSDLLERNRDPDCFTKNAR